MANRLLRAVVGSALIVATVAAQAATLSLANGGGLAVTIHSNLVSPNPTNTSAITFSGSLSGAGAFNANPFYTYCVEFQSVSLPFTETYNIVSGLAGFVGRNVGASTVVDRLGALVAVLGGLNAPSAGTGPTAGLNQAENSAAIQLAIWESVYEGNNPLDVNTIGTGGVGFRASNIAANVLAGANALLSAAASETRRAKIYVLTNANLQDFLLVPAPATLALAGLGLVGIAVARRRRA